MTTILIEKNIMVPMHDGVRLATDIYRLEGSSPTPVLIVRTPYNKDRMDAFAWAAAQSWSNGVVGTFGGSYLGCTQWLPAREQPPASQKP